MVQEVRSRGAGFAMLKLYFVFSNDEIRVDERGRTKVDQ